MNTLLLLLLPLFSFACEGPKVALLASTKLVKGSLPAKAESKSYGKGITSSEAPIALAEALKRKDELQGKEIVVKAEVSQVCQMKGCWMMLKDGDKEVRVTFADYAFFVPKDSARREAVVQGKLFDKEVSAAEARHYAKDAKQSPAEIAKIQAPVLASWFEASGLTLTRR